MTWTTFGIAGGCDEEVKDRHIWIQMFEGCCPELAPIHLLPGFPTSDCPSQGLPYWQQQDHIPSPRQRASQVGGSQNQPGNMCIPREREKERELGGEGML